MRRHLLAFAVALNVWLVGNLVTGVLAQVRPAVIQPTGAKPVVVASRIAVTPDARCVGGTAWAWYAFTCNGYLPNCNGGCWVTGSYPTSACIEEVSQTCVQEQITVNARLYRSNCTSTNGFNCNACVGDWQYFSDYNVTTWRCQ